MTRTILFATLFAVTAALPLDAQSRRQSDIRIPTQTRKQTDTRTDAQTRKQGQAVSTAQARGRVDVPPGQWPSAGMCRIWIDGVPAGRQPAESDCTTARRRVPANGRVLEGSARPSRGRDNSDGRNDDDQDDDRYGRDADDRSTRRFIDRNGLECEEKAVTKNGKRSYDLKCREPKRRNQQGDSWPVGNRNDDRYCVDANRDRRCDSGIATGYPTTLPDMLGALLYGQGQRTDDITQWLGAGQYQVRYTDMNHDRNPERVRWLDGTGSLLQEWMDSDRDGRADIVNIYSAGRLVRSIGGR